MLVKSVTEPVNSKKSISSKNYLWAAIALIVIVTIAGFVLWPKSIVNLGKNDEMNAAGVYAQWEAGNIVAVVRHAERCDRSSNPCLGPADGITRIGNDTGVVAGMSFKQLGLNNTDILTSPLLRTSQTAFAMFDKVIPAESWLLDCETDDMLRDIMAHKSANRNLILVTHSGCIGRLEKQLGYPHAKTAEYTSSLFISLGPDKKPKILGLINVQDWQTTLKKLNKKP